MLSVQEVWGNSSVGQAHFPDFFPRSMASELEEPVDYDPVGIHYKKEINAVLAMLELKPGWEMQGSVTFNYNRIGPWVDAGYTNKQIVRIYEVWDKKHVRRGQWAEMFWFRNRRHNLDDAVANAPVDGGPKSDDVGRYGYFKPPYVELKYSEIGSVKVDTEQLFALTALGTGTGTLVFLKPDKGKILQCAVPIDMNWFAANVLVNKDYMAANALVNM